MAYRAAGASTSATMFLKEGFDGEAPEVSQRGVQGPVVPIPPGKRLQPFGDMRREPWPYHARRIARHDRVRRDVLRDDSTARDHCARPDIAPGQDDSAVPDPDVVSDGHAVGSPPVEERVLVRLALEIGRRAIGEMRLRGALHRMVAGVDPRHRRNRAELAD